MARTGYLGECSNPRYIYQLKRMACRKDQLLRAREEAYPDPPKLSNSDVTGAKGTYFGGAKGFYWWIGRNSKFSSVCQSYGSYLAIQPTPLAVVKTSSTQRTDQTGPRREAQTESYARSTPKTPS